MTKEQKMFDPRTTLIDLLNLPEEDDPTFQRRAEEFVLRHGTLREQFTEALPILAKIASEFRILWNFGMLATRDPQAVPGRQSAILDVIFDPLLANRAKEYPVPAVRPNFLTGEFEVYPRDPLDAVALEYMRSRKAIHRCERCSRFFIKTFSRERYCSTNCGTESRTEAQREWMRSFRAQQKQGQQKSKRGKDKGRKS